MKEENDGGDRGEGVGGYDILVEGSGEGGLSRGSV